jgi:hypothetical protein
MWRQIAAVAVLVVGGCAAQQETFVRQREAERAAPSLDFQARFARPRCRRRRSRWCKLALCRC